MRYSLLVYLTKMGRTLLEAADYLFAAPADDPVRSELLESGRQMLGQIRAELEQHNRDLRSNWALEALEKIEKAWGNGGLDLTAALEAFVQRLPDEVCYQVRALFIAGLGSTWDAMESVYEYMRDDPRFDPVVVRTPTGRAVERDGKREQEIIYQDFLTPMGIPSLGYDEYDIETDCPELAFTNQPYENCTLEQFWPENIAKYTRLVYLPYFLPYLMLEEHKQALCQLPVFRYAWKVLGASDRHFRFYSRYASNNGGNMLVTGLPKLDPVVKMRDKKISLPKSWSMAVKGRKVFLWNTWYIYPGSSLIYCETIIEWFRSHTDCALVWRPHPMTDTVTKLYYPPEIYAELQRCIEMIKELPNAVYDEEPSCNAAFSCSDAQLSDYSSLMCQYLPLDKPLLWIKNSGYIGEFDRCRGNYFIDPIWMEEAAQADGICQFLERIRNGVDAKAAIRKKVLQRDIPLADGHCGERVCNALWDAMLNEDLT